MSSGRDGEGHGLGELATRHLWVGNIPDVASQQEIHEFFSRFGELEGVKVLRKKNVDSGKAAFVDFRNTEGAVRAYQSKDLFHGRSIRKDFNNPHFPSSSRPRMPDAPRREGSASSHGYSTSGYGYGDRTPRLYISELPLDVNEDDIREVFSRVGPVAGLRLIRKADYAYAFVNYGSAEEAQEAIYRFDKAQAFPGRVAIRVKFQRTQGSSGGGGGGGSSDYSRGQDRGQDRPSDRGSRYRSPAKRPRLSQSDRDGDDDALQTQFPKALNGLTMKPIPAATPAPASTPAPAPAPPPTTAPAAALPARPPGGQPETDEEIQARIAAYDRQREAELKLRRAATHHSRDAERERERLAREAERSSTARAPFVDEPSRLLIKNLPTLGPETAKGKLMEICSRYGKVVNVELAAASDGGSQAIVQFSAPSEAAAAERGVDNMTLLDVRLQCRLTTHLRIQDVQAQEPTAKFYADPANWVRGATRTLFVGNLEADVAPSALRETFDEFTPILSIDIKPQKGPFAYAFIKFPSVAVSTAAREKLNKARVGRFIIKIGFAKTSPTASLWLHDFRDEPTRAGVFQAVRRFGRVLDVRVIARENGAYVQMAGVQSAQDIMASLGGRSFRDRGFSASKLAVEYQDAAPPPSQPPDFGPESNLPPVEGEGSRDAAGRRRGEDMGRGRGAPRDWGPAGGGSDRGGYRHREDHGYGGPRPGGGGGMRGDRGGPMDRGPPSNNDRLGRDRSPPGRGRSMYAPQPHRRGPDWDADGRGDGRRPGGLGSEAGGSNHPHDSRRPGRSRSPPMRARSPPRGGGGYRAGGYGDGSPHHTDGRGPPMPPPADEQRWGGQQQHQQHQQPPMRGVPGGPPIPPPQPPPPPHQQEQPREGTAGGPRARAAATQLYEVDTDLMFDRFPIFWRGQLSIKKSTVAVKMHLLNGNSDLVGHALGPQAQLQLKQRMKLGAIPDSFHRHLASARDHCLLIARPAVQSAAAAGSDAAGQTPAGVLRRHFVDYLAEKQAAGLVQAPGGNIYLFPPCDLAHGQVARAAPQLEPRAALHGHLLVVVTPSA